MTPSGTVSQQGSDGNYCRPKTKKEERGKVFKEAVREMERQQCENSKSELRKYAW